MKIRHYQINKNRETSSRTDWHEILPSKRTSGWNKMILNGNFSPHEDIKTIIKLTIWILWKTI